MITRLICTTILGILTVPLFNHPATHVEATNVAHNDLSNRDSFTGFHPPGPALKEWRLNTNFENVDNWRGLAGHENCSQNIYSFPAWYEEEFVFTLPTKFIGKQIILPVNGHFVFQEGTTTFLTSEEQETTCRGREVKFTRTSRADWFDPDNWIHRGDVKTSSDESSLLNLEKISTSSFPSPATAHVERVPCQYDSVRFPVNSSFNLKITTNVSISKFFLGDKSKSQADTAIFMSSLLGKLQFQKAPETIFSIRDNQINHNNNGEGPSAFLCVGNDIDSDRCICSNYINKDVKQKICALAKCDDNEEENCPNPITPHGFCCSVCGFHVRIRHSGSFQLLPLYTRLKEEIAGAGLEGKVHAHLSRYKESGAHLVIIPNKRTATTLPGAATGNNVLEQIGSLVSRIESILKQERAVIGVTLTKSWDRLFPSDGTSDGFQGSGLGGGLITLIVILILVAILAGIALFIFMYNKKNGFPSLSFSSMTSVLTRMPSLRIPIVPGRRSSTLSNSLNSFGFARFSNDRVSTVTIDPGKDGRRGGEQNVVTEAGSSSTNPGKSSSIRRTEQVDDETLPVVGHAQENVIDANSGSFGFSSVTYDLVAGASEAKNLEGQEEPPQPDLVTVPQSVPVFTIPEVNIVDLDPDGSKLTSSLQSLPVTSPANVKVSAGTLEEPKGVGKFIKPGFVTSRLTKTYKKLGDDEEEDGRADENLSKATEKVATGEASDSGKRVEKAEDDSSDIADGANQLLEVPCSMQLETNEKTDEDSKVGPLVEF